MSRKSVALILVSVVLLAVAGFGIWLTRTENGRDFILQQAQVRLQSMEWSAQSVEGRTRHSASEKNLLDALWTAVPYLAPPPFLV